jgi:hypothetical protein
MNSLLLELVLQQQQEEYEREGIQWEHIDYFDNMVICNLIGKYISFDPLLVVTKGIGSRH